jgi:hypothetical protein
MDSIALLRIQPASAMVGNRSDHLFCRSALRASLAAEAYRVAAHNGLNRLA